MPPELLSALLEGLHQAQQAVRALGLAGEVHGQPAWPFGQRLAAEVLRLDPGLARRLLLSLVAVSVALLALLVALAWRRGRRWCLGGALLALVAAPWPQPDLLLAPAVPTSLHLSPTGFTAASIVQGRAVYEAHCVRCHGTDGRGEGPDVARLAMWPPTLNGGLLWKRLEGELFWRVRAGMQDRHGRETMPATALADADVWAVLDYLQAHAAGRTLAEAGAWERPVRLPDAAVRCGFGRHRRLGDLRGQRVLLVSDAVKQPDPRLVSVALSTQGQADCVADASTLREALALALGVAPGQLAGQQVIVDRGGWLRACSAPGSAGWSEEDLVCRSGPAATPASPQPTRGDGLDGLIRRMDAEPVRLVRGGFPH